jgi:putative transposase
LLQRLNDGSRMSREVHVRFCEGLGVQLPRSTYPYLPMARGFRYLVAVMDWHSRKILSWRLSNTLDADFCIEALEEALVKYGTPEIFNTDQGSQFTSEGFLCVLNSQGIRISMDGKGKWMDNVFIQRLWKSLKYENVYLHGYDSISAVGKALESTLSSTTTNDVTKVLTGEDLMMFTGVHYLRSR